MSDNLNVLREIVIPPEDKYINPQRGRVLTHLQELFQPGAFASIIILNATNDRTDSTKVRLYCGDNEEVVYDNFYTAQLG